MIDACPPPTPTPCCFLRWAELRAFGLPSDRPRDEFPPVPPAGLMAFDAVPHNSDKVQVALKPMAEARTERGPSPAVDAL